MAFAEEFKEVERRALVENTAQDVFNILKDLESQASLHASRWIWELLQNARDAALHEGKLRVYACITQSEIFFQHNGAPFTADQVAHLIHHGSTKYQEEGLVGRFGTGFLSSHIISKLPRVSGCLDDGKHFSFVLDRTGVSPKELTSSMERSSQEFVTSVSSKPITTPDHSTRFAYPITSDVRTTAQQGIDSLEAYAPYVLAFNDEIESIEIARDNRSQVYKRQANTALGSDVQLTKIEIHNSLGEIQSSYSVASVASGSVSVAVVAQQTAESFEIQFGPQVPRLFMAFPLFGTEGIGFPGVVDSREFRPKKDRDGLYLGQESTEYNNANKALIKRACPLFLTLLSECAKCRWKGIDLLCGITTTSPLRGVDEAWLQTLIKTALVEKIRETAVLLTCSGQLIIASNARIPVGTSNVSSHELWKLLHELSDSDLILVEEVTALSWESNVRGWAKALGKLPEQLQESMTVEKCANKLAAFKSLDELRKALRPECDPIEWCNKLYGLIVQAGHTPLFESLSLLPDQLGILRKRQELNLDVGINEQLKDIGELLELPIRARLLHREVTSANLANLLQGKTQNDALAEICTHLRLQSQNDRPVSGFRDGNIQLFAWILNNDSMESLDSFPALTQVSQETDQPPSTISLVRKADVDAIPLAPPGCWPKDARAFSELFPARKILSSDYHTARPDDNLWAKVSKLGYVRISPIFEITDFVQDFIPGDALTDDVTHKSKKSIATTQIAFLREKNIGLLDSARNSKVKCLLLLKFLAAYMIGADKSWTVHPEVECECEKTHKCWKAGWCIPLKENKWVYLGRNRSDYLSVDSLSKLLKDESEIFNLLSSGLGPMFLATIGISPGDVLMRVMTPDEDSRVIVIKSFIQMFQAAGGNIQQVNDLAAEIAEHPETIKELQDRAETRRKIKKNQDVGKAVENAFRLAVGSGHGLKVERVPVGSDYSVEPENDYLDEAGKEVLLQFTSPTMKFLIEIKATTVGTHVRMTDVQGKKAKENQGCYALCVVVLPNQEEIDEETIREKSKFVFDIGKRIEPLVDALESLEGSRRIAITTTGQIELEMHEQSVKFKIGREVWETGVGFADAVKMFGGRDIRAVTFPAGTAASERALIGQSPAQPG